MRSVGEVPESEWREEVVGGLEGGRRESGASSKAGTEVLPADSCGLLAEEEEAWSRAKEAAKSATRTAAISRGERTWATAPPVDPVAWESGATLFDLLGRMRERGDPVAGCECPRRRRGIPRSRCWFPVLESGGGW